MMTLSQVTVLPPTGSHGIPIEVEEVHLGPAVAAPCAGDCFKARDAHGLTHRGVVRAVENLERSDGAALLGPEGAREARAAELRIVRLTNEARAS